MVKEHVIPERLQQTVRGPGGQELQSQLADVQHLDVVLLKAAARLGHRRKFCLYIVEFNRKSFSL